MYKALTRGMDEWKPLMAGHKDKWLKGASGCLLWPDSMFSEESRLPFHLGVE